MVTPPAQILVIEENALLASRIQDHLQGRDFRVVQAPDADQGLALAGNMAFDFILLNVGSKGLDVLASLRREQGVPVLLMAESDAPQQRIDGFSRGADDYLAKPFSLDELEVRIRAILRRVAYERRIGAPAAGDDQLQFSERRRDVCHAGRWAGLTDTEFRLLALFWHNAEQVLDKPFLYQQALRRDYSQHDRGLDMHISNIRRKLLRLDYGGCRLESVWGKGYLLRRLDA